ncbi:MAG: uridine kinase family protein [Bacteroidia bacterium]
MKPYLVGIAGGSASGKSRFLRQLSTKLLNKVSILSLDDFYKPVDQQQKDENGVVNFDLPDSINKDHLLNCLNDLKNGKDLKLREYDFNNPNKTEDHYKHVAAKPIILIEGLFIFYFKEVFSELDLKIFIHADEQIRFARRIARDTQERGITPEMVTYQWNHHVKPSFDQYLKPFKNKVDIIVNNNNNFVNTLNILHIHLEYQAEWQTNLQ